MYYIWQPFSSLRGVRGRSERGLHEDDMWKQKRKHGSEIVASQREAEISSVGTFKLSLAYVAFVLEETLRGCILFCGAFCLRR